MQEHLYVMPTKELREERHRLAPDIDDAFHEFSKQVFSEGALPSKIKQLIAVAVAHVTQCPYCIQGHTRAALVARSHRCGDHGGDLGGRRNARRRKLRSFHHCAGYDRGSEGGIERWRRPSGTEAIITGLRRQSI